MIKNQINPLACETKELNEFTYSLNGFINITDRINTIFFFLFSIFFQYILPLLPYSACCRQKSSFPSLYTNLYTHKHNQPTKLIRLETKIIFRFSILSPGIIIIIIVYFRELVFVLQILSLSHSPHTENREIPLERHADFNSFLSFLPLSNSTKSFK